MHTNIWSIIVDLSKTLDPDWHEQDKEFFFSPFFFFFFFFLVNTESQTLRASGLLGRCSTTWATPSALFYVGHTRTFVKKWMNVFPFLVVVDGFGEGDGGRFLLSWIKFLKEDAKDKDLYASDLLRKCPQGNWYWGRRGRKKETDI
jgi:hypothetical protein